MRLIDVIREKERLEVGVAVRVTEMISRVQEACVSSPISIRRHTTEGDEEADNKEPNHTPPS